MRPLTSLLTAIATSAILVLTACGDRQARAARDTTHADHAMSAGPSVPVPNDTTLPADADHVLARLNASSRHSEYVMVPIAGHDSVRAWIVYPERSTKAPVVVVIHEIFGLSPWVRGVADQLAAAGYVAIAPDLLSTKPEKPHGWPDSVSMQDGIAATSTLTDDVVQRSVDAAAKYAMALPAALPRYGVIGFCWGGGQSFLHAVHSPTVRAAVVYYGAPPEANRLASVRAPVLGLYGGNDARITTTVPRTDSAFKAMKKVFEPHVYDGAGHGFLRAQSGEAGANLNAAKQAWPTTLAWFQQYLARDATTHR